MRYYINSITTDKTLQRDIKELIPDMTMRRRMSHVVRMGVTAAMESIHGFRGDIDAIITATGLGCLADSEKFLANIIENDEQMLNPTPFIQSTFNTIGAQIALLTKNHNYNMTYTHRALSFESAMLDAMIRLDDGNSEAVLIGAIDETTPTQYRIMERMGAWRGRKCGEGAVFFVLTSQRRNESVAVIETLEILTKDTSVAELHEKYGEQLMFTENMEFGSSFTASAEGLYQSVRMIENGEKNIVLVNNYGGENLAVIGVKSL